MERIDVRQYPVQDHTTDPSLGAVGTVLEDAKEQARSVADTAVEQTKGVFANIGSDLSAEAHNQKLRMAKGLDGLSTELDEVALKSTGRVPSFAGEAADRTRTLSRWLENTDTADMVRSVEDFGRRRPGMFILGTAVAGMIAGRVTRSMIDDRSPSTQTTDAKTPTTVVYPTVSSPVIPTGSAPAGAGSTYGSM